MELALFLVLGLTASAVGLDRPQRQQRHVLVCGLFGAGDFTPMHSVAVEAVRAGHRVTVLNERIVGETFNLSGMDFVPFPDIWSTADDAQTWILGVMQADLSDFGKMALAFDRIFIPIYRNQHKALLDYIASNGKPDLLFSHAITAAPIDIAHKYGIPLVLILPQQAPFQHTPFAAYECGKERGPGLLSRIIADAACRLDMLFNLVPPVLRLNAVRAEFGYTDDPDFKATQYRMIMSSVPGLSRPIPYPPVVHFVGPLITASSAMHLPGSSPQTELLQWLGLAPAIVLAFGTTALPRPLFMQALIDGSLQASGPTVRVLVACLACNQTALPMVTAQERVRFEPWVPQRDVLSHPNVLVFGTHCGFGSISEAMYNGKAILAYPFHWDQHDNAGRVVSLGAGLRVNPHTVTDASLVKSVVQQLLNGTFTARSKAMGAVMRQAGGVSRAVEILEDECEFGSRHLVEGSESLSDFFKLGLYWGLGTASALWLACFCCFKACCVCYKRQRKVKTN